MLSYRRLQCEHAARSRWSAATPAARSATSSSAASCRPPGATVFEQMQTLRARGRRAAPAAAARAARQRRLPREPRRAGDAPRLRRRLHHHGADRVPADVGLEHDLHATVLLETGMVEMHEPETMVRLEAPGGVVEARAVCRDGRCESVEFTNVPCFADRLDAPLEVEGLGTRHRRRRLRRHVVRDRRRRGARLRDRAARGARALARRRADPRRGARAAPCVASREPRDRGVSIVQIAEPWQGVGKVTRNAVVVAPGRLDRSATGTGLSARLAVLHARGLMRVGDAMTHASAIGSTFDGRIVARRTSATGRRSSRRSAAAPGSPASRRYFVDADRPFPRGLLLADTWGVSGLDTQSGNRP